MKEIEINRSKIIFLKGDITKQKTDAIVNAANSSLMGGGGVDGAIHRAGGPAILKECDAIIKKIERLPTGKAVLTTGGELPAKYVIHTVGPIYKGKQGESRNIGGNQEEKLRSCYIESLRLAAEEGLKSISFPSISTGAYRYPLGKAAPVAIGAVKEFLQQESSIKEVCFVLYNNETYEAYINV
ncbi:MAG: O-acetyl-ADP-ribose deacetylase [Candidatus Margulisiibacteriota bacterium]|nr:O-acetyl-ADP-ribose deacetylase [Candidatus Margulisiibacteriota bacterium]